MSLLLSLASQNDNDGHDFTERYNPPIDVSDPTLQAPSNWSVALMSATCWFSMNNVAAEFENNEFRYNNGSTWKTITLPDGTYQLSQINSYVQAGMKANGDSGTDSDGNDVFYITLTGNTATLKVDITIANSYQLDLSGNYKIRDLLGYDSQVLDTNGTYSGEAEADMTRGLSAIQIHASIVGNTPYGGSYANGTQSDILYTFPLFEQPGYQMNIEPNTLIYLPIGISKIQDLRIRWTDQNGVALNFDGQPTTVLLHLKKNP